VERDKKMCVTTCRPENEMIWFQIKKGEKYKVTGILKVYHGSGVRLDYWMPVVMIRRHES